MNQAPSLARQNTVLLALAFVLMELLVLGLMVLLVLLPLGRRSADDLAGLMVLSAQTWAELPPQTRPAFETELMHSHALALRAEPPGPTHDGWHPPYFFLLEQALAQRTGAPRHLSREQLDSGTWYWASVPSGGGTLSVGISATRIDSQPLTALLAAGADLQTATAEALTYLDQCLNGGYQPGMGHAVPDRLFWAQPAPADDADDAQAAASDTDTDTFSPSRQQEPSPHDTQH